MFFAAENPSTETINAGTPLPGIVDLKREMTDTWILSQF
jgi:hypothetical protein